MKRVFLITVASLVIVLAVLFWADSMSANPTSITKIFFGPKPPTFQRLEARIYADGGSFKPELRSTGSGFRTEGSYRPDYSMLRDLLQGIKKGTIEIEIRRMVRSTNGGTELYIGKPEALYDGELGKFNEQLEWSKEEEKSYQTGAYLGFTTTEASKDPGYVVGVIFVPNNRLAFNSHPYRAMDAAWSDGVVLEMNLELLAMEAN